MSFDSEIVDGKEEENEILNYLMKHEQEWVTPEEIQKELNIKLSDVKKIMDNFVDEKGLQKKKVAGVWIFGRKYAYLLQKRKVKVIPFTVTISFKYPHTGRHPQGRYIEVRSRVFYTLKDNIKKMKEMAVKETLKFLSQYSNLLLMDNVKKYRKTGITELPEEEKYLSEVKEFEVNFDVFDWDYSKVRFEENKVYDLKGKKVGGEVIQPHLGILRLVLLQDELRRRGIEMTLEELMENEKIKFNLPKEEEEE